MTRNFGEGITVRKPPLCGVADQCIVLVDKLLSRGTGTLERKSLEPTPWYRSHVDIGSAWLMSSQVVTKLNKTNKRFKQAMKGIQQVCGIEHRNNGFRF